MAPEVWSTSIRLSEATPTTGSENVTCGTALRATPVAPSVGVVVVTVGAVVSVGCRVDWPDAARSITPRSVSGVGGVNVVAAAGSVEKCPGAPRA